MGSLGYQTGTSEPQPDEHGRARCASRAKGPLRRTLRRCGWTNHPVAEARYRLRHRGGAFVEPSRAALSSRALTLTCLAKPSRPRHTTHQLHDCLLLVSLLSDLLLSAPDWCVPWLPRYDAPLSEPSREAGGERCAVSSRRRREWRAAWGSACSASAPAIVQYTGACILSE